MTDLATTESGFATDRGPDRARPGAGARLAAACEALYAFAPWLAVGVVVLGFFASAAFVLDDGGLPRQAVSSAPRRWPRVALGVGSIMAWHCLAGYGAFVSTRFVAALALAWLERLNGHALLGSEDVARAVQALGAMAEALRSGAVAAPPAAHAVSERERRLAEVAGSIRAAEWALAATGIEGLDREYPDDRAVEDLKTELATARAQFRREQQAELVAAQAVNDPDRVLEIYHALIPAFEADERAAFDRELAPWFLTLIHRRLRTGTIQVDVVNLADRFSQSFATTAEGASVRAGLPTLRRSAGLCPWCGQPRVGPGDTCIQCRSTPDGTRGQSAPR